MTTTPTTPVAVVQGLSRLTEKLYDHVRSYSEAERHAAQLRARADLAESKAFLRAEGSMDLRKHTARVEVAEQEEEALIAEAVVRSLKAKIKALETDIDVHRTFGATIRAELSTLGYDPAP